MQMGLGHGEQRTGEQRFIAQAHAMCLLATVLFPIHAVLLGGRLPVHRKYIYVEAEPVILPSFPGNGGRIVDLCKKVDEIRLVILRAVKTLVPSPLVSGDETLEIGPGHKQVDIVIPRNESLVTNGANKSAVGEGITDAVLTAKGIHIFQNAGKRFLNLGM
jgi:hypothetical protein